MFLLSSITSSLKQGSKAVSLLQLRNPANDTPAEQVQHAKAWEQRRGICPTSTQTPANG